MRDAENANSQLKNTKTKTATGLVMPADVCFMMSARYVTHWKVGSGYVTTVFRPQSKEEKIGMSKRCKKCGVPIENYNYDVHWFCASCGHYFHKKCEEPNKIDNEIWLCDDCMQERQHLFESEYCGES